MFGNYPKLSVLALVGGLLVLSLATRKGFSVDVMKDRGTLAREVEQGAIENVYRLQVMNRTEQAQAYRVRAGGLDGKGGFLAMMHPQESVTDHTQPRGRSGGSAPSVTINVYVEGATGNNEVRQMVNEGVSNGLQTYDSKVLPHSVRRISMNPRRAG